MLDRQNHEITLKRIIRDIYLHPVLSALLVFKGGTCLYLFYGLDRFSTDLDFNFTGEEFSPEIMTEILRQHLILDETKTDKRYTWLWIGSFAKGRQKVKVEISKRVSSDRHIVQNFYGLSVNVMAPECMFAHKLCAIVERRIFQNRDLYDAHFMFKKNFEIDEKIIMARTKKTLQEYFRYLHNYIKKNVNASHILQGMGELLDDKRKEWVKQHLVEELLFELAVRSGK